MGVTQLHDVVYLVCWKSSTIHRYNATTHERLTDIVAEDLREPHDIAACQQTSQLYVVEEDVCLAGWYPVYFGLVWRVSSDGEDRQCCWSSSGWNEFRPVTLSVTSSRVLVTSSRTSQLLQLDAGGDELRRVQLPDDMYPRHAVESQTDGTFIVSHRNTQLKHGWVSEVNTEGHVLRQFSPGLSLGWPAHIAVDSQGNIFVADLDNDRILLLDAQLALRRVIIDKHQLNDKRPRRLCYNEQSAQLMVRLSGGRVSVFAVL